MAPPKGVKPIHSQSIDTNASQINSSPNSDNNSIENPVTIDSDLEAESDKGGVNLSPSAWRQMEKLINIQVSVSVEKHTKTLNEKVDALSDRIEGIRDSYEGQIGEIREKLTNPDLSTDEAQNLRLVAVETEVKMIKELQSEKNRCDEFLNYHHLIAGVQREQRAREWSLRLYDFQSPWSDRELDGEGIYQEVFRPVLQKVIESGEPSYPTDYFSVIERAHPLAPRSKGITPWIFRFHSRKCLFDFMLNKRSHMEALAKKAADKSLWKSSSAVKFDPKKRCRVAHDLAPINRRTMTFLHQTNIAFKCKTTSVGVSFKPKGVKSGWVQVTNPFSPTLEGLVTPLPQISSLLTAKSIINETFAAVDKDSFIKNMNIDISAICRAADRQTQGQEDGDELEREEEYTAEDPKSQPAAEQSSRANPPPATKRRQTNLATSQTATTRSAKNAVSNKSAK